MRRIRGLFLWVVLAVFALGQGAALAACPMRLAALATAEIAEPPPCHPQPAPAQPEKPSTDHKALVGCLCALACKGVTAPAPMAGVEPPKPIAAEPVFAARAWRNALHSLDPPVPRAQG